MTWFKQLRVNDSGFSLMSSLAVFVVLGAVFLVVMGATSRQIYESRMTNQIIKNEYGNDLALKAALEFLNNKIADPSTTVPVDVWLTNKSGDTANVLPITLGTAKTFTVDETTYSWYVTDHNDYAIVHTAATTMKRTTEREHKVVARGVTSYVANVDKESTYAVSALGAWSDAVGFETTDSNLNITTDGDVGLYQEATIDSSKIVTTGQYVGYDPRVKIDGNKVGYFPLTLDLNGKYAQPTQHACPLNPDTHPRYKGIWQNNPLTIPPGMTVDLPVPAGVSVSECYLGVNIPDTSSVGLTGGGILTTYIRDTTDVNVINGSITSIGSTDVHMLFEGVRGSAGKRIDLGHPSSTNRLEGVYIFAPESTCRLTPGVSELTIVGSIVCKRFEGNGTLTVEHQKPNTHNKAGRSRLIYALDHRN